MMNEVNIEIPVVSSNNTFSYVHSKYHIFLIKIKFFWYNSYFADQEEIYLQQRNCAIFPSFWHLGRSIHFWGGVPYFWRTQIHLRILQGIIPVGRIAIMYGDLYLCLSFSYLVNRNRC